MSWDSRRWRRYVTTTAIAVALAAMPEERREIRQDSWVRRMMPRTYIVLLIVLVVSACREGPSDPPAAPAVAEAAPVPNLPDNAAGRLIARAINAAGGWAAWQRHRDASFITTLTIFDVLGNATSETIFLHKMPLHNGLKTRLESIGLEDEVVFGFDGRDTWMLRGGEAVTEPTRTAFTRFHALNTVYWFSLPFILAELPVEMSYVGSENDGKQRWEKVRVAYNDVPGTPADWIVVYLDATTGLIDRVHSHVRAEFLRQTLWVGRWQDYRDLDGIKKERRRTFFPADLTGKIVGNITAEQLVEHVRFDNGFTAEQFTKPLAAGGGSPAG